MELKLLFLLAFVALVACDVGVYGSRKSNCKRSKGTWLKKYREYVKKYRKLYFNYYRHRERYRGLLASYRRFQALVYKLSLKVNGTVGEELKKTALKHLRLIIYYGDEDGGKEATLNMDSGVVDDDDTERLSDFEEDADNMEEAEKPLSQEGEESKLDEFSPDDENIST